jgi:hypothetical protein
MPEESDPSDPTRATQTASGHREPLDGGERDTAPREREDTPPPAVIDAAERLTHLAREAHSAEEAATYRADRDDRLAEHGYTCRVRAEDTSDVLVLHPADWVEEGTVHTDRIADLDRGIEVALSGPGESEDWAVVEADNRALVEAVRTTYGDVHGDNAAALADFLGNHYAKPVASATRAELREFLVDYYPRNAWPTDEQRAIVEESVQLVFEAAGERCPLTESRR